MVSLKGNKEPLKARFAILFLASWAMQLAESLVFLTICLRQKGSSESKPVDAPDLETGK
ncbi:DUF6766 family protein [Pedobacter heparinus]|uniref:DUF6766 family protein n=1 Tax=Pedobacter heparinus TaxID=984 RepID=UPI002931E3E0|nr:DUF6766 family protein [Pedobacter heparinus]